ncbi:MAG: O-methyltransferase [Sporolactobacillus sp.]
MIDFEKLSAYAAAFSPSENKRLQEMEAKAKAIYIPIMQPSAMAFVQQLIHWTGAKQILELGTAIGYSAIRMRLAAGPLAEITTVEREAQMIAEAEENIRQMGFASSIHVVSGDATMPPEAVQTGAPYDLILIDAAKAQYEKLFNDYKPFLRPGGIILTDNILFHGLVYDIDSVKKKQLNRLVHKVDDYNHFLAAQKEFDTVFLTIGDGLAVSTRKSDREEQAQS